MDNRSIPGIPSIDISAFTTGEDQGGRQSTANELAHLASVHGCVAISGHGVPQNILDEAFAIMKELFDLPYEDKMKAKRPDDYFHNRGYIGMGRENVAKKTQFMTEDGTEKERLEGIIDHKEGFEIGAENNPEQQNIWLPEDILPNFRPFMTKLFREINIASLNIMEALIMGLHIRPEECEAMRKFHSGRCSEIRLAHYLPLSAEQLKNNDIDRISAHTDFSLFTILFQADQGGLEFENRSTGEWMAATPKSGYLYMNIGDVFERFSNGRFPSSKHRVVAPKSKTGCEPIPSRYSIPFFVAPEGDANIVGLPSLVAADGKSRYDPTSFKDFAAQMYVAVHGDNSASGTGPQ